MTAIEQARRACESFALTKAIVLEDVADGKRTAIEAITTLDKQFNSAAIRFFRLRPQAQRAWNQYGPLAELAEVRRAFTDGQAAWSALLDRVRKAREERTRVL